MSATTTGNGAGTKFVGQSMRRKEDPRLITGQGSYVDDINLPGQLWAAWVRSPEAHAKITSIDTSAAKERAGVVAVYTNADLDMEAGLPMARTTLARRPSMTTSAASTRPRGPLLSTSATW